MAHSPHTKIYDFSIQAMTCLRQIIDDHFFYDKRKFVFICFIALLFSLFKFHILHMYNFWIAFLKYLTMLLTVWQDLRSACWLIKLRINFKIYLSEIFCQFWACLLTQSDALLSKQCFRNCVKYNSNVCFLESKFLSELYFIFVLLVIEYPSFYEL